MKQILALDFSRNGFHVATGSDDHTCKVEIGRGLVLDYETSVTRTVILNGFVSIY